MGLTIKEVWAIHGNESERTIGEPTWFFEDKAEAEHQAIGRGWYGGNAPVTKCLMVIDRESGEAYRLARREPIVLNIGPAHEEDVRAAALAKLSPYEKKLLGITETA